MKCAGIVLGLLLMATTASAQAIVSYEVVIRPSVEAPPVATLNVPADILNCVDGHVTISQTETVWTDASKFFTIQMEPNATQVCQWSGPKFGDLPLTVGQTYIATIAAVNEAGLKGDASPASNPFGLASKPPTISRIGVTGR